MHVEEGAQPEDPFGSSVPFPLYIYQRPCFVLAAKKTSGFNRVMGTEEGTSDVKSQSSLDSDYPQTEYSLLLEEKADRKASRTEHPSVPRRDLPV